MWIWWIKWQAAYKSWFTKILCTGPSVRCGGLQPWRKMQWGEGGRSAFAKVIAKTVLQTTTNTKPTNPTLVQSKTNNRVITTVQARTSSSLDWWESARVWRSQQHAAAQPVLAVSWTTRSTSYLVNCPTRQSLLLSIGSLHRFPYPDNKEV